MLKSAMISEQFRGHSIYAILVWQHGLNLTIRENNKPIDNMYLTFFGLMKIQKTRAGVAEKRP